MPAVAADPPLAASYLALLELDGGSIAPVAESLAVLDRDLPTIDLKRLMGGDAGERKAMATAASEWGFFHLTNHGVGRELLEEMRREQARLFSLPFEIKNKGGLKGVMQEVADAMSPMADTVAGALAGNLGHEAGSTFLAGRDETTCVLRLNRYPICMLAPNTFGLVPHTDSDFLTILSSDQVGGLQLMKDSRWVSVKPRKDALIVNIGDLFQAWSNNMYQSVEHKVLANYKSECLSIAYFMCPSYDSLVGTCGEPSPYNPFTFGEYRRKVQDDVKRTWRKIGLKNFLKY